MYTGTVFDNERLVLSFVNVDFQTLSALELDAHNNGFIFVFWESKRHAH